MRTLYKLLLIGFCISVLPVQAAEVFREIRWQDLIPKGWDPGKELRSIDLTLMSDSDPRAIEALERMKDLWERAPTEAKMANKKIRLAGYVIPLERKGEEVLEFLLVPYFGACIHSPPPPVNQIIHAVSPKPLGKMRTMEAFWVNGTLSIKRSESAWGGAGYRLEVDQVSPYEGLAVR